jgi:phage-related minor tail protein
MAQGAQQGANKNGDLLDTLNEYSVQFSAMGMSAEEFTGVLIDGAKNGAFSIDKVGDAVKEFTIRSKDGSKTSISAFEQLGFNADQMTKSFAAGGDTARQAFDQVVDAIAAIEDPVAKNSIGVSLFGTQFEDLEAGAIEALGNIQSQTDMAANTLDQINNVKGDTLGSMFKKIGRQMMTDFFIPIGDKLVPKLQELSTWMEENAGEISDAMSGAVKVFGTILGGVVDTVVFAIKHFKILLPILIGVAAAMAAQFVIGTLIPMYKAWRIATVGMSVAQAAFNAVMAANPIGLLALAIGAVIAAVVLLIMNWDSVKKYTVKTWQAISDAFVKAFKKIKDVAMSVFDWLMKFFRSRIGLIVAILGGPITMGLFIIANWQKIKKMAVTIWKNIVETIVGAFRKLKSGVTAAINWLMSFFRTRFGKIVAIMGGPITAGLMIVANWKKIKAAAVRIWSAISSFFSRTIGSIKSNVVGIFNSMKKGILAVWDAISGFMLKRVETFSNNMKKIFGVIKSVAVGVWDGLKDRVRSVFDWVTGHVTNVIDGIKNLFSGVKTFVKDIFNGLVNLIKAPFNLIIDLVNKFLKGYETVLNKVISTIDKLPNFKLPGVGNVGIPDIDPVKFDPIPPLAEGGTVIRKGTVMVGEEGPELLNLPRGARVTPLDKVGGDIVININDAKILNNRDASLLAERIVSVLKLNGIKPRGV